MDGKRGAPLAANADQSVEWGVGGDVPPLVPKVSTRNGGNARGTQAGRVTPWFLVDSSRSPSPVSRSPGQTASRSSTATAGPREIDPQRSASVASPSAAKR